MKSKKRIGFIVVFLMMLGSVYAEAQSVEKSYDEFRKTNKLPAKNLVDEVLGNYMRQLDFNEKIQNDEKLKLEAAKMIQAEKLLYNAYKSYVQNLEDLQENYVKGNYKKEELSKERMEQIGQKSLKIIKVAMNKIYDALPKDAGKRQVFLASGSRYVPDFARMDDNLKMLELKKKKAKSLEKEILKQLGAMQDEKELIEFVTAKSAPKKSKKPASQK